MMEMEPAGVGRKAGSWELQVGNWGSGMGMGIRHSGLGTWDSGSGGASRIFVACLQSDLSDQFPLLAAEDCLFRLPFWQFCFVSPIRRLSPGIYLIRPIRSGRSGRSGGTWNWEPGPGPGIHRHSKGRAMGRFIVISTPVVWLPSTRHLH